VMGSEVPQEDLEAEEAEVSDEKIAMLFTSGRSSGPKKGARGKPAPKKSGGFFGGGGAKKSAPKRAADVDDSDLFVHEGTNGFQGDENAFVYRAGLA